MFWAVAGAMSSAQLGISLAPAIRAGLIHGLSVTGANLEESLFRLVAYRGYKDFPEYRYFTKSDDARILAERMRRVTDTSIPEDEAFRAVEKTILPTWNRASESGERRFWHEYFYELVQSLGPRTYEGDPEACWLLAAARARLPIMVPGYEDSTFGNIFASYVKTGQCSASIVKSGIEYMADFYDRYEELSGGAGVGFFQIGGGIAGDFPNLCRAVPRARSRSSGEAVGVLLPDQRLDDVLRVVLRRDPEREDHLGQAHRDDADVRHRVRCDDRRAPHAPGAARMQTRPRGRQRAHR
jgi:deoxyhypusine synthase